MSDLKADSINALRTHTCRMLLDYWWRVRGSAPIPNRTDIDPGMLKSILPELFMLNMIDRETATYRLVGTAHRERIGVELTGRIWGMIAGAEFRKARTGSLWQAIEHPCGYIARYEMIFTSGARDAVETLLLPLHPKQPGNPPLMIGAAVSTTKTDWISPAGTITRRTAEKNSFLDLGFGVPDAPMVIPEPPDLAR